MVVVVVMMLWDVRQILEPFGSYAFLRACCAPSYCDAADKQDREQSAYSRISFQAAQTRRIASEARACGVCQTKIGRQERTSGNFEQKPTSRVFFHVNVSFYCPSPNFTPLTDAVNACPTCALVTGGCLGRILFHCRQL